MEPIAGAEEFGGQPPGVLTRYCLASATHFLNRIEVGRLELCLPDGRVLRFGQDLSIPPARIEIHDWSFFRRVLLGGDVALGETYVERHWDSPDLVALIALFHSNLKLFDAAEAGARVWQRWLNRAIHISRRNRPGAARENIAAHYDLGDQLFELFLDPTWSYSCALFDSTDATLEQAQLRKIERVLELARVEPGQRVLEIGSGWGSLALAAAQRGATVRGLTLSQNQLEHASRRAQERKLQGRAEFVLRDYRAERGEYDRVISVEMLEAVGHEYLTTFFAQCERLLKPGGRAVLQVITVPDQRYESYRQGCDWIQRYIFPGGLAPSLTALCNAITRSSRLVIDSVTNIGPHYAPTLRCWRLRFEQNLEELRRRGYDTRFQRMWRYYLAYCEAGFACGTFGDLQIVLVRPEDRAVPPWNRD
jgi:cyclopropane-fatty-acyl-phospholipid synthase